MFAVFVVDDDAGVLNSLTRLLRARSYEVHPYTSPLEFLTQHNATIPGCALFDLTMPGLDGLQLHQALKSKGSHRPVIFMTANGDIPTGVRAMKGGAVDFLTKPVNDQDLFAALSRAEEQDFMARRLRAELASIETKIATLTPREREVLTHVVAGRLNKQIAGDLGTVEKTIKVHRGRMMEKLGVRNVVALVRMAEKAGIAT
jgi:FixJ family two-component response regulator